MARLASDPSSSATPPVALTIAGSDSGGGAGIQADLATFAALGVHGTSVITALTAQNTRQVARVHVPPADFLEAQLEAVLGDLPVAAVKTGMLASLEVAGAVARWAGAGRLPGLVIDPVLVSSSGQRLFVDGPAPAAAAGASLDQPRYQSLYLSVYLSQLLPHALVATPNAREAAVLLGERVDAIRTVDDQRQAAVELAARIRRAAESAAASTAETGAAHSSPCGPKRHPAAPTAPPAAPPAAAWTPAWIVVKGGHLPGTAGGDAVDVVLETGTGALHELRAPWVETANDHGTGCTFAAAAAAHLARGAEPLDALRAAKAFVHDRLRRSMRWRLGTGHGPVAHTFG